MDTENVRKIKFGLCPIRVLITIKSALIVRKLKIGGSREIVCRPFLLIGEAETFAKIIICILCTIIRLRGGAQNVWRVRFFPGGAKFYYRAKPKNLG